MTTELLIRRARRSDIPFLTNSWLKSYRDAFAVKGVPNSLYYHWHHKILDKIIPRAFNLVLCSAADENSIIGWVCAERMDTALVVHYVYVKQWARKHGFARKMVEALEESGKPPAIMFTHKTKAARDIEMGTEHLKEWIYNPYLLYMTLPDRWNQDNDSTPA